MSNKRFGSFKVQLSKINKDYMDRWEGEEYMKCIINVFENPTEHGSDFVISQEGADDQEKITLAWGKFHELTKEV